MFPITILNTISFSVRAASICADSSRSRAEYSYKSSSQYRPNSSHFGSLQISEET